MATFLDVEILNYFMPLFIFIFIFIILYSILQKSKLIGGKPIYDILVSLTITIVSLLSGSTFIFITSIIPWFIMLIVAVVLFLFASSTVLKSGIPEIPPLRGVVIFFSIVIIISAITTIFGPIFNPYSLNANPDWELLRTLFHPRLLGAIVMLIIVANTIKLVAENK